MMKLRELSLRLRELLTQAPPDVLASLCVTTEAGSSHLDDALGDFVRSTPALLAVVEAAALKRNVLIHDGDGSMVRGAGLVGEWICIPREDFDRLRAALEAEVAELIRGTQDG